MTVQSATSVIVPTATTTRKAASVVATPQAETATASTTTDTATLTGGTSAGKFDAVLRQLRDRVNGFEHQVTWQIDHNTAVTAPNSLSSANASAGATANASSGAATNTSSGSTANSSSGTAAKLTSFKQTVSDGFTSLETAASAQLSDLSSSQQTQLTAVTTNLGQELARFQKYAASRASGDVHQANQYDAVASVLHDKINAFEHQATAESDASKPITDPTAATSTAANTSTGATSNTSTGATSNSSSGSTANTSSGSITIAQAVANGFASIESQVAKLLGHTDQQYTNELQADESALSAEQTRFTSFLTARKAYQTANVPTASTTHDIAAA